MAHRISLLLAFSVGAVAAPVYTVTNIGSFGGPETTAWRINEAGIATGWSSTPGNVNQAFRSTASASGIEKLGAVNSDARAVNTGGTAIGTTYTNSGAQATVWSPSGTVYLNPFGGDVSYGMDIDNAGDVVGMAALPGGEGRAFLYANGVATDLGTLGGSWSSAQALNDGRLVAGSSLTAAGYFHAFLWSAQTGMKDLGTLGGSLSYGSDINAKGHVVGASTNSQGYLHAFLNDGAMRDLGTLSGGILSSAYGVNNQGSVVGYSMDGNGRLSAFVWRDGVMYDLNALLPGSSGWVLTAAYGINDQGQIVGAGLHNGVVSAFRLDPLLPESASISGPAAIPEPGTAGLLTFGVAVALVSRGLRGRI